MLAWAPILILLPGIPRKFILEKDARQLSQREHLLQGWCLLQAEFEDFLQIFLRFVIVYDRCVRRIRPSQLRTDLTSSTLVAGDDSLPKKVSPALFITLFTIVTAGAGAKERGGRVAVAGDHEAGNPLRFMRLLVLLLTRKSIGGGV